ncbi:hypothetical protein CEXT_614291 [Caerostris extrusa]|uniref:Uncharacterized protein n=1 Tax=Caerostris extrusa TaxID=172846 RepID=A0AAV4MG95_CAEEX|nr:hypothetical protein CEXT_614291 [Caerostris extrusa]
MAAFRYLMRKKMWPPSFSCSRERKVDNFFSLVEKKVVKRIGVLHKTLTTRLPITTVERKNGRHVHPLTSRQSHIDSIHSPQRTRNTIMKRVHEVFEIPIWNFSIRKSGKQVSRRSKY